MNNVINYVFPFILMLASCFYAGDEIDKEESIPADPDKPALERKKMPPDNTDVESDTIPLKDKMLLITDQIAYNVLIKSPEVEETGNDNIWLNNIKTKNREKFIQTLLDAVKSGKLKAYAHPLGYPVNTKEYLLTTEKVNELLHIKDTVYTENLETGALEPKAVEINLDESDEFIRLTFIEEWYFDEKRLEMIKKVNGLSLAYPVYNPDGTLRGYSPIFYVWFHDTQLQEFS